jgi:hypothetical protein
MNSEQYLQSLKGVVQDIESGQHANIMIQVASKALQMIHTRVVETGVNAKGQKYREYSDWYKEYKQKAGKFRGFTDFSFTTRMWTNIQIIKERCTATLAVISAKDKGTLGSRTQIPVTTKKGKSYNRSVYVPSNYEKLEKNSESFGLILDLSQEEIKELKKLYDDLLLEMWSKHGLR